MMNLRTFDKLKKPNAIPGIPEIVHSEIRKIFVALNEYDKYNRLRNDLDAYLHYTYLWAVEGDKKPDPKDFGID